MKSIQVTVYEFCLIFVCGDPGDSLFRINCNHLELAPIGSPRIRLEVLIGILDPFDIWKYFWGPNIFRGARIFYTFLVNLPFPVEKNVQPERIYKYI